MPKKKITKSVDKWETCLEDDGLVYDIFEKSCKPFTNFPLGLSLGLYGYHIHEPCHCYHAVFCFTIGTVESPWYMDFSPSNTCKEHRSEHYETCEEYLEHEFGMMISACIELFIQSCTDAFYSPAA